ncbi:MAG TPA: hypothetical protein VF593_05850 [Chthoniobacteraceae bacterium]|jgi:hypothetical protein
MNTVRFSQVVAQSGAPEPYTLWTAPEEDGDFQRALKQQRVLSVHQETTGGQKDFGTVGYGGEKGVELLIFPKSVAQFDGRRVIGIKYELLKTAEPAEPKPKPKAAPAELKKKTAEPKPAAGTKQPSQPKQPDEAKQKAAEPKKERTEPKQDPGELKKKSTEPRKETATPTRSTNILAFAPEETTRAAEKTPPVAAKTDAAALTELRKAMKALEQGKAVAAYQLLQKLESRLS